MKGRVVNVSACCTGLLNGTNNRVRASFVFAFEFAGWRGADDASVRCSGEELMTTSGTSGFDGVLKFYVVISRERWRDGTNNSEDRVYVHNVVPKPNNGLLLRVIRAGCSPFCFFV